MTDEILYSLVACDVSVTSDENSIKSELMKRYSGVTKVTRMFFDDEEETPKTCVQVDFTSSEDAAKILQDRSIVIGGICRRVYSIKKPAYQRTRQNKYQEWQDTRKPLSEQDLINMFEEQKTLLTQVMNSLDSKLNNIIAHRQDNHHTNGQPALSNNAQ